MIGFSANANVTVYVMYSWKVSAVYTKVYTRERCESTDSKRGGALQDHANANNNCI